MAQQEQSAAQYPLKVLLEQAAAALAAARALRDLLGPEVQGPLKVAAVAAVAALSEVTAALEERAALAG